MNNQLLSTIIEITEQEHAELLLDASEKRFRQIMDGSIEGILIHRHSRTLFVNHSLVKMLGYSSYHEVIALESLSQLVAPHDRERVTRHAGVRLNGEFAPEVYEFDALHYDGSIRCIELKSSVIDWQGKPALLSAVFDRTEHKLMQQELDQLRRVLAHRNRLNILGEMAASIAHELNQPLAAIANRCGAIKNRLQSGSPDLGKISVALESIEAQALRSGEIIKQLRGLVATKDQQHQKIDIAELLNICLDFISFEGRTQREAITTEIAGQLPPVTGDPIQIQQVVLNLIGNANHAMQHLAADHRHLTVSATQPTGDYLQVAVSDNGRGISKQREAQLFESFFTTKDEGMGMGLPISRKIIEAHHGKLWFTRNVGHGVTFRFTLPILT